MINFQFKHFCCRNIGHYGIKVKVTTGLSNLPSTRTVMLVLSRTAPPKINAYGVNINVNCQYYECQNMGLGCSMSGQYKECRLNMHNIYVWYTFASNAIYIFNAIYCKIE